jgi:hypothetical protein
MNGEIRLYLANERIRERIVEARNARSVRRLPDDARPARTNASTRENRPGPSGQRWDRKLLRALR